MTDTMDTIGTIALGSAVGLAWLGAVLSPWLKEKWPGVFGPKKGGS